MAQMGTGQINLVDAKRSKGLEMLVMAVLVACSLVAVLVTIGIVLSLFGNAMRFFSQVSVWDFVFGLKWSPQTALRADQVGSSGAFGSVPLVTGTLLISSCRA